MDFGLCFVLYCILTLILPVECLLFYQKLRHAPHKSNAVSPKKKFEGPDDNHTSSSKAKYTIRNNISLAFSGVSKEEIIHQEKAQQRSSGTPSRRAMMSSTRNFNGDVAAAKTCPECHEDNLIISKQRRCSQLEFYMKANNQKPFSNSNEKPRQARLSGVPQC